MPCSWPVIFRGNKSAHSTVFTIQTVCIGNAVFFFANRFRNVFFYDVALLMRDKIPRHCWMWRDALPLQNNIRNPRIAAVFHLCFVIIFKSGMTVCARFRFAMQDANRHIAVNRKRNNALIGFDFHASQVVCIARSWIDRLTSTIRSTERQMKIRLAIKRPHQIFGGKFNNLNFHDFRIPKLSGNSL